MDDAQLDAMLASIAAGVDARQMAVGARAAAWRSSGLTTAQLFSAAATSADVAAIGMGDDAVPADQKGTQRVRELATSALVV